MERNPFRGEMVRLGMTDMESATQRVARWATNSEYYRLLDSEPTRLMTAKAIKEEWEKEGEPQDYVVFDIITLVDDKAIGFVSLDDINHIHGGCWVGIGLGEREYWGRGYGTEAMRLALGYAFDELHLHRVNLGVFEYNPRAIRSYEKAGFVHEGRVRQELQREGRHWDGLYMGILRGEWDRKRNPAASGVNNG
jgi:RimJ/RimL family protein N-acetyltransferase